MTVFNYDFEYDEHDKLVRLFRVVLFWCARRASSHTMSFYGNTIEEIGFTIQLLQDCFDELTFVEKKVGGSGLTTESLNQIFKAAFTKAKEYGSYLALDALFSFKHDIQEDILHIPTPKLEDYIVDNIDKNYIARFTFHRGQNTYSPKAMFTYKETNWPVFWDEGGGNEYVHFTDSNGKEHNFSLVWDWEYPIDRYLELQDGEKEKIIL